MAHPVFTSLKSNAFFTTGLIAATVLLPTQAFSEGFYAGFAGGLNQTNDASISGTGINADAEFDYGNTAAATLGYDYSDGFRGEIELSGRWSDTDTISNTSGAGDVRALSAMANALYDISLGSSFTPYIGVGIGAANVEASGISPVGGSTISDDDTAFAYQGIVGTSYQLNNTVSLNADYRYFATSDLDYSTVSGVSVSEEYSNHTVLFGISFGFGGDTNADTMPGVSGSLPASESPTQVAATLPEPAPVPETEPELAAASSTELQTAAAPSFPTAYRIMFDWNKSDLDEDAMTVIRLSALNAINGKILHIRASGHADRSGTEKNNNKVSEKRARAVKQALIDQGVAPDHIAIDWFGEVMMLVSTPDGEREPQNRRVEIVFE